MVYSIPYTHVLDSIRELHIVPTDKLGEIFTIKHSAIPKDVLVRSVEFNNKWQAFDFLLMHEDFEIVEQGACFPRIDNILHSTKYKVIEVVEVNDD